MERTVGEGEEGGGILSREAKVGEKEPGGYFCQLDTK